MGRPRKIRPVEEDVRQNETPQPSVDDVVTPLSSTKASIPNALQKAESSAAKMSDVVSVLESKNDQLIGECQALKAKNEEYKGIIQNLQGQVIALKEQAESTSRKLFEAQNELIKSGSKMDVVSDLVEIVDTVSADNPNVIKSINHGGKKFDPTIDEHGFAHFRVSKNYALGQIYCTNQRFVLSDKNIDEIHGMVPKGPYLTPYKAVRHTLVIKSHSKTWKPHTDVD